MNGKTYYLLEALQVVYLPLLSVLQQYGLLPLLQVLVWLTVVWPGFASLVWVGLT